MKRSQKCALFLLAALPFSANAATPQKAEEAYQQARKAYYALKPDAARRKFRHNWLSVAARFEAVEKRYPKSDRAPDALFTAGELLEELSRISRLEEDLLGAAADYRRLVEGHGRHKLADDAALALARIHLDRLGQPNEARKFLQLGLAQKGDRARELKALLSALPKEEHPAKKVAVAKAEPAHRSESLAEALARATAPSPKRDPVAKAAVPAEEPAPAEPVQLTLRASADGAQTAEPTVIEITGASAHATRLAGQSGATAAGSAEQIAAALATDDGRTVTATRLSEASDAGTLAAALSVRAPLAPTSETKARLQAMSKRDAELTLAEQLGLKVRRVVIDAGHGGHDTGAIGKGGTREKDVSLAIAKKLAQKLTASGLEVVLTRDSDEFIRLEDRSKIANDAKGDLFISVHCNSAPSRKLEGVETYTLNIASDRYSIRLAARENAASEKGMSDLQFILADLATKANTDESARLASKVQSSLSGALKPKYGTRDLGTKEALFYVLLGARMPAILVETSFLSHPDEEKRLASAAYQEEVATAIAAGVKGFLDSRDRVAKID